MSKGSVNISQLKLHPEILDKINIEAFRYLCINDLSDDLILDHIDLNAIPVIKKPGQRVNEIYLVIGSIAEYLWLLEQACFQPDRQVSVDVKESFDLKKSLNSISYRAWGRRNDPGANAVSAALFTHQENCRKDNHLPTMTNDYLSSVDGGRASRLKRFTGFDNRALVRSNELSEMPTSLQQYIVSQLALKVDLKADDSDETPVAK